MKIDAHETVAEAIRKGPKLEAEDIIRFHEAYVRVLTMLNRQTKIMADLGFPDEPKRISISTSDLIEVMKGAGTMTEVMEYYVQRYTADNKHREN